MNCTRCEGTGYLNLHQIPEEIHCDEHPTVWVPRWLIAQTQPHDVQECDCCGDGEGCYGIPGEHYSADDPSGANGPYAGNGGLCHCH
jgi:hypothetical protein